MNNTQIKDHILNQGILLPNGQIELKQPLKAFKAVYICNSAGKLRRAIANLVIPRGSIVNVPVTNDNKLRASEAFCWSIIDSKTNRSHSTASGVIRNHFKYFSAKEYGAKSEDIFKATAKTVHLYPGNVQQAFAKPDSFNFKTDQCGSGIHFFLDVNSALAY